MLRRRRASRPVGPPPGRGKRTPWQVARAWIIPVIGGVTPVLLIVVNIAAFIVQHVGAFRWTITVLAFVSGIMLDSWTALNIYRALRARFPSNPLLQDSNQELMLVLSMLVIIVLSFISGYFCYQGLGDASNLPNRLTFVTGAVAIATPILLVRLFDHLKGRSQAQRPAFTGRDRGGRPPAPPAPPVEPSASASGYTPPPRFLPPS
ncbi:MAG TPA: hypothetical protein VGE42_06895 [Candidatus Dormibacteraeota bacterium]